MHAGQSFWVPAPYPVPFWLQRVSLLRWVNLTMALHPFACAVLRCLLDGIPSVRLPGSAVYPRCKPLRTSRGLGGYACTPAPRGRDLHPHGELSYKARGFAVCLRTLILFRPTGRTKCKFLYDEHNQIYLRTSHLVYLNFNSSIEPVSFSSNASIESRCSQVFAPMFSRPYR
jgi:hypothetical protein